MHYNGEHLLPGQIGHFFSILSLVASLLATIAYFKAARMNDLLPDRKGWIKLARTAFFVETISVLGVFFSLYYIIYNHYFEYFYAWNHSSRSLQFKYILSCFWEGSEGSFLLWSFWHCVLGWILIKTSKTWEAGVMTVISFAQFCLASMLIGIYFFGYKVGSNPFILWRQQMPDIPIFADPNYLQLPRIAEGNDLNTLLQNYWMVIHPPILFLGFASTIVPFAYAIAGLFKKDHTWIKISIPWAAFSGAVLGTGIMMGAAWAYESLSFGGYWAWDPVENASLVPWIVMIAGLHTNLIFKSTGYSLRTTYLFYILSFVLVLYSTFLTRSGILGDTSVHAFTDLGMNVQLLLFVLVFFIPAILLFIWRYKNIPALHKEENTNSREFWMFIGSLVLFLSAIIIAAKTSVPVYNKLFGANIAPPEDPEFSFNQVQIFILIIIGILTAVTQYFKYKSSPQGYFSKNIVWPTVASLIVGSAICIWGNIHYNKQGIGFLVAIYVGVYAAIYAIIANAAYIWLVLKGKLKVAGASVAHVGFGMILLGVLISSSKKEVLSWNTTGIAVFKKDKKEDPAENITLFKGVTTDMGKYMVTYVRDTFNTKDRKRYYEIDFKAKNGNEQFKVYPDIIKNNKGMEGFSPNPDSKHYWNRDIFVYISSFQQNDQPDTATFRNIGIKPGDTTFYSNGILILNKVQVNPEEQKDKFKNGETALFLDMTAITKDGRRYPLTPGIVLNNNELTNYPDTVKAQSLIVKFNKVSNPQDGKLEIGVKESGAITDLVTLKVYEFPMINILWLGVVVMVIGFFMSIYQRIAPQFFSKE
jgi:cytochrome c-type biogenesis protein CcmF